jgi:hypothetical protein
MTRMFWCSHKALSSSRRSVLVFPGITRWTLVSVWLVGVPCLSHAQQQAIQAPAGLYPPVGIFESDQSSSAGWPTSSWAVGAPRRNGVPLFTFELATNETYRVDCSEPHITQGIDGGGLYAYPGLELGTWRWNPQSHQLVLTATNSSHMASAFPRTLCPDKANPDRLEAVGPFTNYPPVFARSFHRRDG